MTTDEEHHESDLNAALQELLQRAMRSRTVRRTRTRVTP